MIRLSTCPLIIHHHHHYSPQPHRTKLAAAEIAPLPLYGPLSPRDLADGVRCSAAIAGMAAGHLPRFGPINQAFRPMKRATAQLPPSGTTNPRIHRKTQVAVEAVPLETHFGSTIREAIRQQWEVAYPAMGKVQLHPLEAGLLHLRPRRHPCRRWSPHRISIEIRLMIRILSHFHHRSGSHREGRRYIIRMPERCVLQKLGGDIKCEVIVN